MTKNPLVSALSAALYIAGLVSLLNYASTHLSQITDTPLAPIMMLSLLVLSVLVMGYVFLLTPLQMYLDGQKKEAVTLLAQSMGVFAAITVVLGLILFFFTPTL